jgi:hypothetical protein
MQNMIAEAKKMIEEIEEMKKITERAISTSRMEEYNNSFLKAIYGRRQVN